jgi:hypothetical protein
MLTRIRVADPSQFEQLLQQASKKSDQNLYILFTGSKNPSNNQSWCPDCTRAEPLIDAELAKVTTPTTLLFCDVDRERYRSASFPYRTDNRLNLRCVPTLMKWQGGKCVQKLNDTQCQSLDALQEFFESY